MWISFRLSKTEIDGSFKERFSRGNRSAAMVLPNNLLQSRCDIARSVQVGFTFYMEILL